MKRSVIVGLVVCGVIVGISGVILASIKNPKNKDVSHTSGSQSVTGRNMSKEQEAKVLATNQVTIKDFEFKPSKITVKKGTKVTWSNQDGASHDITPDKEYGRFKKGPLFSKNQEYSFTFEEVGTYSYHCSPHPYMKATIEVTQ